MLLTGCSDPPPAEEPTGEDLERAWRIAVGDDPLDRTIAEIYSLVLNSREAPTVVVDTETATHEAAAALAQEPGADEGDDDADEGTDGETHEDGNASDEDSGEPEDDRYEIVLTRTLALAQTLDAEGLETLTGEGGTGPAPAAEPADLNELITENLHDAELFTPTEATLTVSAVTTAVVAQSQEFEEDPAEGAQELTGVCDELTVGFSEDLIDPAETVEAFYDCTPEETITAGESELVALLVEAEIDVAFITSAHPAVHDHALVELEDTARAFPHDQYAPVVSSRIAEEVPDVVDEISAELDTEALLTLRRLLTGQDSLTPEEAAEYWLVEEGFIAEPEHWG